MVLPSPGGPLHVDGWGGGGGGGFPLRGEPRVLDLPHPRTGTHVVCVSQRCPGYGSTPARPPAGARPLCEPQCHTGPDRAHAAGSPGRRTAGHTVCRGCPPARRPPLPHGGRRPAPYSRCREQAAGGAASTTTGALPGTYDRHDRWRRPPHAPLPPHPLPAHSTAQQAPPSRERGPARPGSGAAPRQSQGMTATRNKPPAQPRATADSRTSRLRRRILAAPGSPSDPDPSDTAHANARPPRPGTPEWAAEDVSQDLMDTDDRANGPQRALTSAPAAPMARPPAPTSQPLAPQANDGAGASAPPVGDQPPEGPTLDWCAVYRFWRLSPCEQYPPQQTSTQCGGSCCRAGP